MINEIGEGEVGIKMYIQGFYENKRKYIYKNRAHTAKK
jgi:hypothetical protein